MIKEVITIPEGTPTDAVIQYRKQGYDDDTIIQGLQQQGYASQQIFDALNQADQKPSSQGQLQDTNSDPGFNQASRGDTESIVESLVEEKWSEVKKTISDLQTWRQKSESAITKLQHEIESLKENMDKLHEGVLGKISEYDTNLQDVGSSIKAMDQVFKKVLPSLTESVNKLSRISNTNSPSKKSN